MACQFEYICLFFLWDPTLQLKFQVYNIFGLVGVRWECEHMDTALLFVAIWYITNYFTNGERQHTDTRTEGTKKLLSYPQRNNVTLYPVTLVMPYLVKEKCYCNINCNGVSHRKNTHTHTQQMYSNWRVVAYFMLFVLCKSWWWFSYVYLWMKKYMLFLTENLAFFLEQSVVVR